jgi:hypothetical protein
MRGRWGLFSPLRGSTSICTGIDNDVYNLGNGSARVLKVTCYLHSSAHTRAMSISYISFQTYGHPFFPLQTPFLFFLTYRYCYNTIIPQSFLHLSCRLRYVYFILQRWTITYVTYHCRFWLLLGTCTIQSFLHLSCRLRFWLLLGYGPCVRLIELRYTINYRLTNSTTYWSD